jgi:transposase
MANKPIKMEKIRQVLLLILQGQSKRKVSKLTGVHRSVIDRYLLRCDAYSDTGKDLLSLNDEELSSVLFQEPFVDVSMQRQLEFESFYPYLSKELTRKGVTRQLLHQEYLKKYPQGYCYSQFCDLIFRRHLISEVSMVQPCAPGEMMQVDFAGKKLTWCDAQSGEIFSGDVFIAVLPYSGMTFVRVLRSQKQADFAEGIQRALEYFGGVPECLRLDNLKSGVTKADRYEPTFNQLLLELCNHYKMTLDATRASKPKDKAHVERHVTLAYQRIYAPIRDKVFTSIEELNATIHELLEVHHRRVFRDHKQGRRDLFETQERHLLGDLPYSPYKIMMRKKVKVYKDYHVALSDENGKKFYYSVPYNYVGKQVKIIYDTQSLEVYYNYNRIAIHPRSYNPRAIYTTLQEHLPEKHQKVQQGMDVDFLLKKALLIGPNTGLFIEKLLARGQFYVTNYKSCQGVLNLTRLYPAERIEKAAQRSLHFNNIKYKAMEDILKKNLDQVPFIDVDTTVAITPNPNVRGSQSYK